MLCPAHIVHFAGLFTVEAMWLEPRHIIFLLDKELSTPVCSHVKEPWQQGKVEATWKSQVLKSYMEDQAQELRPWAVE